MIDMDSSRGVWCSQWTGIAVVSLQQVRLDVVMKSLS